MWVGAVAKEPAPRPEWALLPGPGGARAAGPNAAAARRPLSPAQGRGSPPPTAPVPALNGPCVPAAPTD